MVVRSLLVVKQSPLFVEFTLVGDTIFVLVQLFFCVQFRGFVVIEPQFSLRLVQQFAQRKFVVILRIVLLVQQFFIEQFPSISP